MYLTKDDCVRILRNSSNCDMPGSVENFKLEPFSKDVRGYLSEHLLLTIEVSGGNQFQFFVKAVSSVGFSECLADVEIFQKEVFVYDFFEKAKSLIPNLEIDCIPKFYYATSNQTIVLENLALQGYYGDKEININVQQTRKALEALARFHAVSIAYEEYKTNELGRRYELNEDFQKYFDPTYTCEESRDGFKSFNSCLSGCLWMVDLFYKKGTEELKNEFRQRMRFVLDLLNEKNNFRKVVCNGDLWTYNTLFKYEDGIAVDCKIIDFQLIRYAPPAHDVTFLIYVAASRENQRLHCNEFYRHYYDSLQTELTKYSIDISKVLPWYEFETTLKPYTYVVKYIWSLYRQIASANPTSLKNLFTDIEELKSIVATEKRAEFMKDQFSVDSAYREYLTGLFNDNVVSIKYNPVSLEECYKILENKMRSKDYRIIDYEVRDGLVEDSKILSLHVNDSEVYTFDVKLLQNKDRNNIQSWNETELKETIFYSTIANSLKRYDRLSDIIPKSYLVTIEKIVFDQNEDRESKNDFLSIDEIKKSIKAVAVLHASSLIFEADGSKLNKTFNLGSKRKSPVVIEILRELLQEKYFKTTKSQRVCDFLLQKFVDSESPSTIYRNTLVHGDLRLSNLSFDVERCVLQNFQTYHYNSPTYDLLNLIYMCSSKDLRDKHLTDLLFYYYEELRQNLSSHDYIIEDVFPVTEFWSSCEEQKYIAAIQRIVNLNDFSEIIALSPDCEYSVKNEESIQEFVEMCQTYSDRNQI